MNHYQARRDLISPNVKVAATRVKGGYWNIQGFRRTKDVTHAAERHMSIEDFTFEQGLPRDGEFN